MKIKLLFQHNSVSKKIIDASILALLLFIVHFIFQYNLFNSYLRDNQIIAKLTDSHIQVSELEASHHSIKNIIAKIDDNLSVAALAHSWLNTESINKHNGEIYKQWNQLKSTQQSPTADKLALSVPDFATSLASLTNKYRALVEKKIQLIYLFESIYSLFLLSNIIFIIYYCKRHIANPINKLVKDLSSEQSHPSDLSSDNELSQLAQTIENKLAPRLFSCTNGTTGG
ncbi:hypothetical protein [Psychromonas sp. MME1]|uniref:hypothetical protein n=1 Tax=Psychromonas sp. MME1 TaxID=3231032 RepID=UPI0034E24100